METASLFGLRSFYHPLEYNQWRIVSLRRRRRLTEKVLPGVDGVPAVKDARRVPDEDLQRQRRPRRRR